VTGWLAGVYAGPMDNPNAIVTYIDVAVWAQITLAEAERRLDVPDGPERMRIAGQDYFWVRDILQFLETSGESTLPGFSSGRSEVMTDAAGRR